MQTVYIGNTLVNDVMLGSQRMDDVLRGNLDYIKTNLTALWDGNSNATTSSWRTVVGNFTASAFTGISLVTGSGKTPYYNFTSSNQNFEFGNPTAMVNAGLSGTGERTVLQWINPTNLTAQNGLMWSGQNSGGSDSGGISFVITSALSNNRLAISGSNTSFVSSVGTAANLGSVVTGNWQMVGYTTNGGNTMAAFEVWLNGNKQALTGSGTWTVQTSGGNNFWAMGLIGNTRPYSGSIGYTFIYNRKLTDAEILQDYQYMQYYFNQ